jgi:hypothetical protein
VLALALKFDVQEFDAALKLLVSLSVRLVVASRTRSGTLEQTFATAALSVYEGRIISTSSLKTALNSVVIGDVDFKKEFANARVSKPELARYYLGALEAANAADSEPWYVLNDDPTIITLEHVMPQNADSSWAIDEDTHKSYLKRIGNLCLLQKSGNEAAANKPFVEKKTAFASASPVITSMIADYDTWGPTEIEARQIRLADLAVKAWPV